MSWSASKKYTAELEEEVWSTNPPDTADFSQEMTAQFAAAAAVADDLVREFGRPCTVYTYGHVNGGKDADPINPTHVAVKIEYPIE